MKNQQRHGVKSARWLSLKRSGRDSNSQTLTDITQVANGTCRPAGPHVVLVSLAIADTQAVIEKADHPGRAYQQKLNVFEKRRFFTLYVVPDELHNPENHKGNNTGQPERCVCHLFIDDRKQKAKQGKYSKSFCQWSYLTGAVSLPALHTRSASE